MFLAGFGRVQRPTYRPPIADGKFPTETISVKDKEMSGLTGDSQVREDELTSALLNRALDLSTRADPKVARNAAEKLDELCEQRLTLHLAATELGRTREGSSDLSPAALNELCDAVTGRLMKYLGRLIKENQRCGGAKLVLIAAARSFICTSASVSGVDEGLGDARLIFEQTLRELTPILLEMPEAGI